MIVSMTGFGRSKKDAGAFSVLVEIKTVNHRFSEYQIRMPRQLIQIEDKLKKKIGEYIQRGRIEVYVTAEGSGLFNREVRVDLPLLDEYYQYITTIKDKYAIESAISIRDLMREEFIDIVEKDDDNELLATITLSAVEEACVQLRQMRITEGKELEKDVYRHLKQLGERVFELSSLAPKVAGHYQSRLVKRMTDFLNGEIDEARILTEVAIFADKADITEELTRLHSHINQFNASMQVNEPIGRKLDFLLQEMNREVNTIGSKANDAEVASLVVEMKSLLEKMKEQVQNIE